MRGAALKVALSALESLGYWISTDPNGQNGACFLHHIFMFFQESKKNGTENTQKDVGFAQHQSNILSQITQKTVCFLNQKYLVFFVPKN